MNDESGGCGRCLLVRNPSAVHNLTAVVMKKSFCPASNSLCTAGKLHLDLAVPGFDYTPNSDAQICGSAVRSVAECSECIACRDCCRWRVSGAHQEVQLVPYPEGLATWPGGHVTTWQLGHATGT